MLLTLEQKRPSSLRETDRERERGVRVCVCVRSVHVDLPINMISVGQTAKDSL